MENKQKIHTRIFAFLFVFKIIQNIYKINRITFIYITIQNYNCTKKKLKMQFKYTLPYNNEMHASGFA